MLDPFESYLINAFWKDVDQGPQSSSTASGGPEELQAITLSMDPIEMNVERFDEFESDRRPSWSLNEPRLHRDDGHEYSATGMSQDQDFARVNLSAQFVPVLTDEAPFETGEISSNEMPVTQTTANTDAEDRSNVTKEAPSAPATDEEPREQLTQVATGRTPPPVYANAH